jgi:DNA-binding PadR family transcriptional regulator
MAPDFLSLFILQYIQKNTEISKTEIPMREVIEHIPESIRPKSLPIIYYNFRQMEQEGYISMWLEKKIPTRKLVKLEEKGNQITALFEYFNPTSNIQQKTPRQSASKKLTDDNLVDLSESITNILHGKLYKFAELSKAQTTLIADITEAILKKM